MSPLILFRYTENFWVDLLGHQQRHERTLCRGFMYMYNYCMLHAAIIAHKTTALVQSALDGKLVVVQILRSHVMVRTGGGWDTLESYLDRHDPCRCNSKRKHLSFSVTSLLTKGCAITNIVWRKKRHAKSQINVVRNSLFRLITDRVSTGRHSIPYVRPSVHPSACFHYNLEPQTY